MTTRRLPAARSAMLGLAALAGACAGEPEPPASTTPVDAGSCVAGVTASGGRDAAPCPGFLAQTVSDAWQLCRDAGGTLASIESATLWTLDVNGDNRPEHAFEIGDVVYCDGAPSAFSCGSLGCPKALYGEVAGAWRLIGSLSASSRDSIELTETVHADGYRDLTIGCDPAMECVERWHYLWRDGFYEADSVDVRGHRVAFADSVHGLYALVTETTLLATPTTAGPSLERYAAGTEVAIVGTAESGDYYYVSPCNACASGFVPASALPPQGGERP